MYRSFVICDDPKGVVECSTVRKFKSGLMKSLRKVKKKDTSVVEKFEKEQMIRKSSMAKFSDASSFQLMKVSQGAQQLNQMIDSWSNGQKYDGQSNDIADDLLKGALELQESLTMLHRMQEATYIMDHLKRQSEKSERRTEGTTMNRMYPNQLKDPRCSVEFQKPRVSFDGSSRNCVEDLKQIIKESLVKQNRFASTTAELNLASEIPSTSSSQSFLSQADLLTESSFSSASSHRRDKGSNLMAKLMGLEEHPSKPSQFTLQKQLEGEKILNQRRTMSDIDTVNARNRQYAIQKDSRVEDKTFKEILEAMHFKGLLKSHSARRYKPQVHHFNHSPSELRFVDDPPPIVLIKPFRTSHWEMVESNQLLQGKDSVLKKGLASRNEKGKQVNHIIIKHEDSSLKFNKKQQKQVAEDVPIKRHDQKEEAKDWRNQNGGSKVLNVVGTPYEKEGKPKEKFVKKAKLPYHMSGDVYKNQIVGRRDQKNTISRKSEEETMKAKIVCNPQNRGEATSNDLRRAESEISIKRKKKHPKQNTTSDTILIRTQKVTNDKGQKKNQTRKTRTLRIPKPEKEKSSDMKTNGLPNEPDLDEVRTIEVEADQPPVENESDGSIIKIEEHNANESFPTDVPMPIAEHEMFVSNAEAACDHSNCSTERVKRVGGSPDVKYILLSCQSFLNHAEKLFNLNVDDPVALNHLENTDFEMKLYMDCANELLERKANHDFQILHPLLLTCIGASRFCISIDRLVEEIRDVIESLELYCKTSEKNLSVDNVYVMVERDIKSKEMAYGIWDSGWRHGFSSEEAEEVVNEIETLVLNGLMDELVRTI